MKTKIVVPVIITLFALSVLVFVFFCSDPYVAANRLSRQGKYQQSLSLYEKLAAGHEKDERFFLNRARCYRRMKDYAACSNDLDRADALIKEHPSQASLMAVLDSHSHSYMLLEERYYLALAQGDAGKALDYANKLVEQGPCATTLTNKAKALAKLKRDNEALEAFNQAVQKSCADDREYPLSERARFYLNHDRAKDALIDLNKSLSTASCAECFRLRGLCHEELNENDAALADYSKGIAYQPNESCYHQRAILELRLKDISAAESDLNHAAELDPSCPLLAQTREAIQKQKN